MLDELQETMNTLTGTDRMLPRLRSWHERIRGLREILEVI